MRDIQGEEGPRYGQHQCRQYGDRLHEGLEQQHQHGIDAQHPGQHRQPEAGEQLAHGLGITHRGTDNARRQRLDTGQGQYLLLHLAQRLLVQFQFKINVAQPVITVDLRRPALQTEAGDTAQHHRPVFTLHHQTGEQLYILTCMSGQFHHDGNLPLTQIEFGQLLLVIACGCDAQGFGNRARGHALLGRPGKIGAHHQLGSHQAGSRGHIAYAGDGAQFARHDIGMT